MENIVISTTEGYFLAALLAGGMAGTSVDVTLFPLDTIKTRLQSAQGFWKAGGFRGIYSGLASAALGSAPTASLFFLTYEGVKYASSSETSNWSPLIHSTAASLAEVNACLIRVPVEVVKQRAQTNPNTSSLHCLRSTVQTEGLRGLYRGYRSTVMREMPFSFIQFPIWEYLKQTWSRYQGSPVEAWQSAVCGATAGAIAASVTTPLDVAKTRIILAKRDSALSRGSITYALKMVYAERGLAGLYSGIVPRTLWISVGGAIFLGVYDKVRLTVIQYYNGNRVDTSGR